MPLKACIAAKLAIFAFAGGILAASGPALGDDGYELMPEGEHKDLVFALCSGCHSIRLVVQQGLSRESWKETLVWMTEEQGMPELDQETLNQVLDYLSTHLGTDHRPPAMN